ncbi:Crp/Fnr family transcriptional regulator [Kitasatospora sp. NPDC008115]|uniref:Crp/Fnr family transcriptional regulator n=1 Tax=Kitasatospora sp. NPDC008115 TaxID=3364022 RepID=UPI0036E6FC95
MFKSADGQRWALGQGRTFRDLVGDHRWGKTIGCWRRVVVDPGQLLILQGDLSDEVYAVEAGVFRVERLEGGAPSVQAFRARGDLIGEAPVLDRCAPRTAQVVAHTRCLVAVSQAGSFDQLISGLQAERLLTQYLCDRNLETQMVQGLGDPEVRLAALVRPLVRHQQRLSGGRAEQVVLKVSRNHLAQGLRLGHRRARKLLDDLSIGRFHSKGMLTIDLESWARCVSRIST